MERFKTLNGYEVKDYYARTVGEALINEIGDLSNLQTTDKLTIVGAINEIFNDVSGDSTKIGDLNDLHTTSKINIVSAINEVNDYAHNIRTVDIGIPDGESFADTCFWDGEFGTFNVHNIMGVLNVLWWLYDIGNNELSSGSSYSLRQNSTTNQYEGGGTIGGTESYDNPFYWSSRNVYRKIIEVTNTFSSTSDTLLIPFMEKGNDPTSIEYKLNKVYDIHGTVSYNDGSDEIQPLESVLDYNNVYIYLDEEPTSPTYNYYVLQVQISNSSVIPYALTLLVTIEFSTISEPQP